VLDLTERDAAKSKTLRVRAGVPARSAADAPDRVSRR
jgi:hypothetical protein